MAISAAIDPESNQACGDSAPATPELLVRYDHYLTGQRRLSANTRRIYLADLATYLAYCRKEDRSLRDMDRQFLRGYVAHLVTAGRTDGNGRAGYARVSVVRKLTALRTFYNFLVQEGWFATTPVPSARSFPIKVEKPLPSFLGKNEAVRLLAAPDDSSPWVCAIRPFWKCCTRLACGWPRSKA